VASRTRHTLERLQGLALPPTHCPFHPSDPAFPPFSKLPFAARALFEFYAHELLFVDMDQGHARLRGCGGPAAAARGLVECVVGARGLGEVEEKLCAALARENEGLARVCVPREDTEVRG
jgi:hypothetical protein